ncbi:MAG: phytoene/squalene synthase family protein [Planctomycetia bacterium]
MTTLAADHAACAALLGRSGSSFALPIRLLPSAKRQGTTALYAFCRLADDLVDDQPDVEIARRSIDRLRADLQDALTGGEVAEPILRALADTVRRFAVPTVHLHEILDGVRMDLDRQAYGTFDDLRQYCHRVASAVGRAAIHIWGFRSDDALLPADACGLAFQLTNILRDIPEDLARGRIYLPAEDFEACACSIDDLQAGRIGSSFDRLAAMQVERAESFYGRARPLDALLSTDGRIVFRVMFGIYRGLLNGVRRAGSGIFTSKVRASKLSLIGNGLSTLALGTAPGRYL